MIYCKQLISTMCN